MRRQIDHRHLRLVDLSNEDDLRLFEERESLAWLAAKWCIRIVVLAGLVIGVRGVVQLLGWV